MAIIQTRRAVTSRIEDSGPNLRRGDGGELFAELSRHAGDAEENRRGLTLSQAHDLIIESMRSYQSRGVPVYFTIGPLTSQGPEQKPLNWARLHASTIFLQSASVHLGRGRTTSNSQVFSTTFFPTRMEDRLAAENGRDDFEDLWRAVVAETNGILVSSRKANSSHGCIAEMRSAEAAGVPIHHVYRHQHLRRAVDAVTRVLHPREVVERTREELRVIMGLTKPYEEPVLAGREFL